MLPDDPMLVADLTAPTFDVVPNGIEVESAEKVAHRLGRSPDRGVAVLLAWFEGPKETTSALEWIDRRDRKRGMMPKVIISRTPLTARRH